MKNKLFFLPNFITIMNVFCGFWAIIYIVSDNFVSAAWLIILAGIFDLLDGKVARLVGATSAYGIELDSMADLISFGLAPAVLFFSQYSFFTGNNKIWIIAFFYLLMGITRLVRFNVVSFKKKNLQIKEDFIGLPIPGAAFAVSSYIIFVNDYYGSFNHPNIYLVVTLVVAVLMVMPVRYKSFPKISLNKKNEIINFLILILSFVLIIFNPRRMFFLLTGLYILYNPTAYFAKILLRKSKHV